MAGIPITGVAGGQLGALGGSAGASKSGGESFGAVLKQAIERVNDLERQSSAEIDRLLTGDSEDLHRTVLAVQKSELAFSMLLEVRNKVVQAYQEIMRIQV